MAMFINTGVPGSGKTYLMIHRFVTSFCCWDNEIDMWVLNDEYKDMTLISNVEGLNLKHLDIETLMSQRCHELAKLEYAKNVEKYGVEGMEDIIDNYYYEFLQEKVRHFFNFKYQQQLFEKYGPVIYLIEESQRYFDTKELGRQKWVRDVLFYFEKHRKLGASIFMDTQHISKLHKGIAVLFESEIQAKPRKLSAMGEFKYNEIVDGTKINTLPIVKKPDKRVFKAYKSRQATEIVKPKGMAFKFACFMAVIVLALYVGFSYFKKSYGGSTAEAAEQPTKSIKTESPKQSESFNRVNGKIPSMKTPKIAIEAPEYEFIRVGHITRENGDIWIIHPFSNITMPINEFEYAIRRMGTTLHAIVPVEKTLVSENRSFLK